MDDIDHQMDEPKATELGFCSYPGRRLCGGHARAILLAIALLVGPATAIDAQTDSPAVRQREEALRKLREATGRLSTGSGEDFGERSHSANRLRDDDVGFGYLPPDIGTPLQRVQWTMQCEAMRHRRGSVVEGVCTNLIRAMQVGAAIGMRNGVMPRAPTQSQGSIAPRPPLQASANTPNANFVSAAPADYVDFGYIPAGVGNAQQRMQWTMRCETMRHRRGSSEEIFCSSLLHAFQSNGNSTDTATG